MESFYGEKLALHQEWTTVRWDVKSQVHFGHSVSASLPHMTYCLLHCLCFPQTNIRFPCEGRGSGLACPGCLSHSHTRSPRLRLTACLLVSPHTLTHSLLTGLGSGCTTRFLSFLFSYREPMELWYCGRCLQLHCYNCFH